MTNANPGTRHSRHRDETVASRRRYLGLTQADLADRIGWSQSSVARAESKPMEWLRVGDLIDLARGVETTPAQLIAGARGGAYEAAVLLRSWPDPRRAFRRRDEVEQ